MKFIELFNEDWTLNFDKIEKIPEFRELQYTPQSEKWHKEGNVWEHTRLVCKEMFKILDKEDIIPRKEETEELSKSWEALFEGNNIKYHRKSNYILCMLAALCHDLGKATSTKWSEEKGDYETKFHGIEGEKITRELFIDERVIEREKLCHMVRHHMDLHHIFDKPERTDLMFKKLAFSNVPIKMMMWLNEADSRGSVNDLEDDYFITKKMNRIEERCTGLKCLEGIPEEWDITDNIKVFNECSSVLTTKKVDKNEFTVYILCGFPGCGKSTYTNRFLSKYPCLSRDQIRCELGINGATVENQKKVIGTKQEEKKVSEIFDAKMKELCRERKSFVIDNTNLRRNYRNAYIKEALKYNAYIEIIYVEPERGITECMERRKGEIGKDVYKNMLRNFEFPELTECHHITIFKQSDVEGKDTIYAFDANPDYKSNLFSVQRVYAVNKLISKKIK